MLFAHQCASTTQEFQFWLWPDSQCWLVRDNAVDVHINTRWSKQADQAAS